MKYILYFLLGCVSLVVSLVSTTAEIHFIFGRFLHAPYLVRPNPRSAGNPAFYAVVAENPPEAALLEPARVYFRAKQWPGAIAAYGEVIQNHPDLAEAYAERGDAKERAKDLFGALQDYNQALQRDPHNFLALDRRGRMREMDGRFAQAAADYDQALLLRPAYTPLYLNRGVVRSELEQWDGALSDLRHFSTTSPPQTGNVDYAQLFVWYAQVRQGHQAQADQELADYMTHAVAPPGGWVLHLADFLLGRITDQQLLAAAASPDPNLNQHWHCEAWFYIGLKALAAGDQKTATVDFEKCVAIPRFRIIEYKFASAKLKEWGATP